MPPEPNFTHREQPPAIQMDETPSLKKEETSTGNNEEESIVDSPVAATDTKNQDKKPLPKRKKRQKKTYVREEKDANGDSYGALSRFPHAGFGGGKTKRSKRKAKKTKKAKRKGRKSKKSRKAKKH